MLSTKLISLIFADLPPQRDHLTKTIKYTNEIT